MVHRTDYALLKTLSIEVVIGRVRNTHIAFDTSVVVLFVLCLGV